MVTAVREFPNTYAAMRDDLAELLRADISDLQQIKENKVNDEEGMEAIAARVQMHLYIAVRALERAGASTDPLSELSNIVQKAKMNPLFTAA